MAAARTRRWRRPAKRLLLNLVASPATVRIRRAGDDADWNFTASRSCSKMAAA